MLFHARCQPDGLLAALATAETKYYSLSKGFGGKRCGMVVTGWKTAAVCRHNAGSGHVRTSVGFRLRRPRHSDRCMRPTAHCLVRYVTLRHLASVYLFNIYVWITSRFKGPFIATQLNSTSSWVELRRYRHPNRRNSTVADDRQCNWPSWTAYSHDVQNWSEIVVHAVNVSTTRRRVALSWVVSL